MSMLPRCTCDPWQAILGNFHPRCNRHYTSPRSAPSPQSPCVCPEPCIWCAMGQVKEQRSAPGDAEYLSWFPVAAHGVPVRPSAIVELRERIAAERNAGVTGTPHQTFCTDTPTGERVKD